jgi:hypothetical protein
MSRLAEAPPKRKASHRRAPPNYGFRRAVALLILVTLVLLVVRSGVIGALFRHGSSPGVAARTTTTHPSSPGHPSAAPAGATAGRSPDAIPPGNEGGPINTAYPGLSTFRGNATRSYYGEGPLPTRPKVLWRYPSGAGMCSTSSSLGVTKTWCGTGWTGQPNVIQHPNGSIEIRFGAYDGHYHFLNGKTGEVWRPDVVTGDLAKGSASSDPAGYPLYYGGSRDNHLRIMALDRKPPAVLWSLDAEKVPHRVWNNDWDGTPLIVGDYLLEGGENSWFYVIKLNRRYDSRHLVQVDPKIVMLVPGYDSQLFRDVHDEDVSIENSVAFHDGVAYFANSGGLVQGWDISDVLSGGTHYRRVFRFWAGDDVDASIAIDHEGYLYVARKMEENVSRPESFPRDHQIGSLMKLDPRRPEHPVVWSVQIGGFEPDGGILGSPALYRGRVYVTYTEGGFAAVSMRTGHLLYKVPLPGPTWMSPVPIDDQLLVGDCNGVLHDFDISSPSKPPTERWRVQLEGCEESTPAVWHGMIWVGARGGAMYGIGDPG